MNELTLGFGNGWYAILENLTCGTWNVSEDDIETVVIECTFRIQYNRYNFAIECYLLDEDNHDTYSIRVYDNTRSRLRTDETQIDHIYLDSTGGGCNGEDLCVCPKGQCENHLEKVDEIIMEILFGNGIDKEGLIIPF